MRYHALACDYDGTIAHHGRVADETIAALGRLRDTGRRLILVTGRQLQDLLAVCPHVELFDRVVAVVWGAGYGAVRQAANRVAALTSISLVSAAVGRARVAS